MDRKFFLPVLVGLLLLISLPYLLGFLLAGTDWVFGGFLLNPIDGHSYLAKMYQGAAGEWRFKLPYTSEPGEGAYLFLFYLALGHLSQGSGLPLLWVFHLARLVGVVIMVTGLVRFYETSLRSVMRPAEPGEMQDLDRQRVLRTAIVLGLFGSGMGWLILFLGVIPSDLLIAEMYPFLSAFINPHFPLGLGLILWILAINLVEMEEKDAICTGRLVLLAGLGLVLAVVQPFGVVVLAIVLAGWILWEWAAGKRFPFRSVLAGASSVALGGLFLVYQYSVIHTDPVLAGWNAQNVTISPPIWDLVISLSPSLLLAGFVIWYWMIHGMPGGGIRLLVVWTVLGAVLAYFPFSLQRRFLTGYFVPLAGLAAFGVALLQNRWPRKKALIGRLVVGFSVASNGLVLLLALFGMLSHAPELYLARDETAAFGWLREYSAKDAVILAGAETGLYIPSQTGRRVVYGHPFETVNAEFEEELIDAVYSGEMQGANLEQLLANRKIDYILYGPRERNMGGTPAFLRYPIVFQQGEVVIFTALEKP